MKRKKKKKEASQAACDGEAKTGRGFPSQAVANLVRSRPMRDLISKTQWAVLRNGSVRVLSGLHTQPSFNKN